TNHSPRTITKAFDFLPDGNYTAEIWSDTPADPNLNHLVKQVKQVNRATIMTMFLASGGGQVMHLKRQ
ncbi:MAG TPA: glycoside hydrolase family 97 C-terminal domain-containing protein, partial [Mucilaginibacter sp.]